MNYIRNGGQQPAFNQQQTIQPATTAFGQSAGGFKPFSAPTSVPSFTGISTNNMNAPNNNAGFLGQQSQPTTLNNFGQGLAIGNTQNNPMFGQANNNLLGQAQTNPVFGQQQTNTPVFGQTQNTSVFGQSQQSTPSFFNPAATQPNNFLGQTTPANAFGNNALGGNSVFGTQPAQQGNTLFNQGGMFNQSAPTNTVFGQQSSTPSLFGQQPTNPSLFGSQPAANSMFSQSATPSLFGGAQTNNSLFPIVQPAQQPQAGFFNSPAVQGGLFNQSIGGLGGLMNYPSIYSRPGDPTIP